MDPYPFKSLVCVHLETTGFRTRKIILISMIACSFEHFGTMLPLELPGLLKKFSFVYNPCVKIDRRASAVNGFTNEMLQDEATFSEAPIKEFLKQMQKPICLVAHNGASFQFPILREALQRDDILSKVWCADSLGFFRNMWPHLNSHKLIDIFYHMMGREAELDGADSYAQALMKCLILENKEFISWMFDNLKRF